MEISELIGSLRCCGKDPNIQNCKNECAFYFDGLSIVHLDQCVKPMTQACADALKQLRAENADKDAEIARLTALANDVSTLADIMQDNDRLQVEVDGLTAIAKARDEGRVVMLPCKAGVKVWNIKSMFSFCAEPKEEVIDRFVISDDGVDVAFRSGYKFSVERIGKTIFLTRAEAEAALGGGERAT